MTAIKDYPINNIEEIPFNPNPENGFIYGTPLGIRNYPIAVYVRHAIEDAAQFLDPHWASTWKGGTSLTNRVKEYFNYDFQWGGFQNLYMDSLASIVYHERLGRDDRGKDLRSRDALQVAILIHPYIEMFATEGLLDRTVLISPTGRRILKYSTKGATPDRSIFFSISNIGHSGYWVPMEPESIKALQVRNLNYWRATRPTQRQNRVHMMFA